MTNRIPTKREFKVGDKIRMIRSCGAFPKQGEELVVQQIFETDLCVTSPNGLSCTCQDRWELIEEPAITLENMEVGTIIKSRDGYYRRILIAHGGEGKIKVYGISSGGVAPDSENLNSYATGITVHQLFEDRYTIYTPPVPPTVTEMTVAEISKALGKTVKVVE